MAAIRRFADAHWGGQGTVQAAASCKIMRAPFSAIIITGAAVLPEVMVGMIEASTTRKRSMPDHAQPLIDHGHGIVGPPHLGGADRMEDGAAGIGAGLEQCGIIAGRGSTGMNSFG